MKNLKKISLSVLIVVVGFLLSATVFKETPDAHASVDIANGYLYKTISSSNASSTSPIIIKNQGSSILGNIVVASSSGATSGAIRIYDASTATSSANATLLGVIRPGVSEQTFIYDANVRAGILIDVPANFNGLYTIMYR